MISVTAIGQPLESRPADPLRRPPRRLAPRHRLARRQHSRPHVRLHAARPRSNHAARTLRTRRRHRHQRRPRPRRLAPRRSKRLRRRRSSWIVCPFRQTRSNSPNATVRTTSKPPPCTTPSATARISNSCSPSPKTAQAILRDRPLDCRVTHVGELIAEPASGSKQPPMAARIAARSDWLEARVSLCSHSSPTTNTTPTPGAALASASGRNRRRPDRPPRRRQNRLVQAVATALGVPPGPRHQPNVRPRERIHRRPHARLPLRHLPPQR